MPIPLPGTMAPDFTVDVLKPDLTFAKRSLVDYRGMYLIILFYPLDFTFVCPSEIIKFSEAAEILRKQHNAEIIIGSTDSLYSHHAWCTQHRKDGGLGQCDCDLFADTNHTLARDYGVLLEGAGIALRGMFIISDKGIIRHVTVNDLPVGRSVDEALRLVQAFQYADKTGDAIPCGWIPERPDDVIVPDPDKKKEYFAKHYQPIVQK